VYICEYQTRLGDAPRPESPFSFSPECQAQVRRKNRQKQVRVAVIGGGFAGLMAARWLGQSGFDVTVFEARNQVGGRVLSNPTFSNGRIIEEGAELIGSFHTTWLELARKYGLAMISRMSPELYVQEQLAPRLRLGGKDISTDEFFKLEKEMRKRVLLPMAYDASQIKHPSEPWRDNLRTEDNTRVSDALKNRYGVNPSELLWKMLEFKLVNDEVASLDKMNFLGLLCKVRAGQGIFFAFEDPKDPEDQKKSLMRYWDELEIFRCADGCQTLAKKIANEIQLEEFQREYGAKIKLYVSTAVTKIDLSQTKGPGVELWSKKVMDQRQEKLVPSKPDVTRYEYVILAIPPSVWSDLVVSPPPWHPKIEIGVMGMDPAIKFFSDVKERFWIKKGVAPYGGSSELGQIWEGTDNQTRIVLGRVPQPRTLCMPSRSPQGGLIDVKQGIVLSVFAGPILDGPRGPHVPDPQKCVTELKSLYPDDYARNVIKTCYANWPEEGFIKTGYASPRLGEIFGKGEKLNQPFHDLLFFAGEHTRMDLFGYMEGALRSGERAAKLLMRHSCGRVEKPAPSSPPRVFTAGARSGYQGHFAGVNRVAARSNYVL
jgi:monoamine oxidase